MTLALCCAGLLISLAQLNARLGAAAAAAWGGLGLLGQQSSAAATHNTLTLGEGSDVPQPAATAAAAEVAAALSRRALRAMLGAWVRGSGGDDGGGGGGDATAPVAPYEWAGV